MTDELFPGFEVRDLRCERGLVHARVGGDPDGPPVLLLHGYPETHLMWHAAAPLLAHRGYRVVAADLPGYGDSHRPPATDDHAPYAKRAMAADLVQAMASLGVERFAVAGHDRGGRVAYRMALDAPDAVSALAVIDIVPTSEVWARADALSAVVYWHWGFLAQPAPLPEALIGGAPDVFFDRGGALGLGGEPGRYPEVVMDAYRARMHDPEAVRGMCEDYRAGATIDRELDDADRARGATIGCRTLVLWGARGALPLFYGDVLEVWRPWAPDVTGRALDASHFVPEDRPEEVASELAALLRGG